MLENPIFFDEIHLARMIMKWDQPREEYAAGKLYMWSRDTMWSRTYIRHYEECKHLYINHCEIRSIPMRKACLSYKRNEVAQYNWRPFVDSYLQKDKIIDTAVWQEINDMSHIMHFKIGCMGMRMFIHMAPFMHRYGPDFPKWAVNYTSQFIPVTSFTNGGKQCDDAEIYQSPCVS